MAPTELQKAVDRNNHVDYVIRYSFAQTGMFAAIWACRQDI